MTGIKQDDYGQGPAERTFFWRSAKACTSNGCVQAASTSEGVVLRDSLSPDSQVEISRQDWVAFLAGVKAGDFDDL